MSLPDTTAISTLGFASEGLPFATYQPGTANTNTLAFALAGLPFFAQGGGGGVAPGGGSARPVVFVCT